MLGLSLTSAPLVVVARSTTRPDTGPPLVPGFDARKTDARPDPLPRTVNSSRDRCECQNAGSLGSVSQGSGVGDSAAAGRWSSRSVRTRVPNCGSRREPPETPLRVSGLTGAIHGQLDISDENSRVLVHWCPEESTSLPCTPIEAREEPASNPRHRSLTTVRDDDERSKNR